MVSQPKLNYLQMLLSHYDHVLESGRANFGPAPSRMWLSSLDVRTGRYPEIDTHPPSIGKRVYRNIDAPKGCSLYWDQASLVCCHALSTVTGDTKYAQAADQYINDFLERCVAKSGIFLWGNHYYFQVLLGKVLKFHAEEEPVPVDDHERGELHEIRPIPPAWELFWRVSPEKTERAIRAAIEGHLVDSTTGEFNRHAEGKRGCSFPEAGGILVQSIAWLSKMTGDHDLLESAKKIANFSFSYRNAQTGLMEINPTWNRWDKYTSTTEVGLWGGCLLQAANWTNELNWIEMADVSIEAWLKYGYDELSRRFFGRLNVNSGKPIFGPKETPYQPGEYSDLWEPLFPAHDYPMQFAESCLQLYQITGKPVYRLACRRWAEMIDLSLPARHGKGGYAEHYGRCIHFCLACWRQLGDPFYNKLAIRLANEAVNVLYANSMFRGHSGEDRCDAVDGVGFLSLALIELDTGHIPNMMGLSW